MEEIKVKLGERSYNIYLEHGQLEKLAELVKAVTEFERILVVSNTTVGSLYGDTVLEILNSAGFVSELFNIPDGEQYKNLETLRSIY
ncbi:MAG: 3-dehydroquinate synthase, partial [Candidatus Sumerlaeia bacterium]|nr:3-dehydroquinate synthase [Candidatus Sumerlaeia bacterium]